MLDICNIRRDLIRLMCCPLPDTVSMDYTVTYRDEDGFTPVCAFPHFDCKLLQHTDKLVKNWESQLWYLQRNVD